jgi:hypothetical protein
MFGQHVRGYFWKNVASWATYRKRRKECIDTTFDRDQSRKMPRLRSKDVSFRGVCEICREYFVQDLARVFSFQGVFSVNDEWAIEIPGCLRRDA